MVVLSETGPRLPPSASARDIAASTEAARLAQCDVYTIPPDFDRCGDAEGAPYVAVDIGQTIDGEWIVIESGDAQFSGVSQIPLFRLWHNLRSAADNG